MGLDDKKSWEHFLKFIKKPIIVKQLKKSEFARYLYDILMIFMLLQ